MHAACIPESLFRLLSPVRAACYLFGDILVRRRSLRRYTDRERGSEREKDPGKNTGREWEESALMHFLCMYVCVYVCVYACICVYVCVCVYVCIYIYGRAPTQDPGRPLRHDSIASLYWYTAQICRIP